MAKHWEIRGVLRDPATTQILGYGRPITVPPGLGKRVMAKSPMSYDVVRTDVEVGEDGRGQRGTTPKEWKEVNATTEDLAKGRVKTG